MDTRGEVRAAGRAVASAGLLALAVGSRALTLLPALDHLPFQLTWPVPGLAIAALWLAGSRYRPWLLLLLAGAWLAIESAGETPWRGVVALLVVRSVVVLVGCLAMERWVGFDALDEGLPGLGRFFAACFGTALVGGGATALLVGAAGRDGVLLRGFASALTVALSMTVVLPFVMRFAPSRRGTAVEWVAQNVALIALVALCAWPTSLPSQIALGFPYVVWLALRAHYRRLLVSLLALTAALTTLTAFNLGALSSFAIRTGSSTEEVMVLTDAYLLALVLVALPLRITVGLEREALDRATAERRSLEQLIAAATGVVIVTIDREGVVTRFSPGAEKALGHRARDLVGRPSSLLGAQAELSRLARFSEGPREVELRHRDGRWRRLSMTVTRLHDAHGVFTELLATAEDITDRVDAERALRDALEHERETAERLRQVDGLKQDLVSTVSHELRTPITSIIGNTEMLLDGMGGDLPAPAAGMVDAIDRSSNRLMKLVDDLLVLSRFEDTSIQLDITSVRVADLVAGAVEALRPAMERAGVCLSVGDVHPDWRLQGDEDQLHRVLGNLLSNAAKFTAPGGGVRLAVGRERDRMAFEVSDSGIGMPPEDVERLFSRFFRAREAYERHIPGTGLGLYITHTIVTQHGGTIEVDSTPGEGSRFRVVLPIRHEQAAGPLVDTDALAR